MQRTFLLIAKFVQKHTCDGPTVNNMQLFDALCLVSSEQLKTLPHTPPSIDTVITSMLSLCKKATIHQVTTVLATSKNVLFPGHNHMLTTGTDDLSLAGAGDNQSVGSSVPVVSRWL